MFIGSGAAYIYSFLKKDYKIHANIYPFKIILEWSEKKCEFRIFLENILENSYQYHSLHCNTASPLVKINWNRAKRR